MNKNNRMNKWSKLFNGIINHSYLKWIEMSGRIFSWSDNQKDPDFFYE